MTQVATKTKKKEDNPWTGYFQQMDVEKAEAAVEYERIMKEDKNKTFMDILPKEFKNFKRSILKRTVLLYIEEVAKFLDKTTLYDGRKFDKKEIVRFMMRGTDYSNFHLAYLFIPRKSSDGLWMRYASEHKEADDKKLDKLYKKFEEENKDVIKEYRDLEHLLQCLKQVWEQYDDRQKVKKGKLVNDYDIEEDGFPRCGRANMCYLFIPVKNLPKNKRGNIRLFNPRTRKTVEYTNLKYKAEDNIYSAVNEKGKKVFLADHQDVADSWSALYSSNKEIYSGWWNRNMICRRTK